MFFKNKSIFQIIFLQEQMMSTHRHKDSESVNPVTKSPHKTAQDKAKGDRIKVFVRFKPLTELQKDKHRRQIEYMSDTELSISSYGNDKRIYCFDHVFSDSARNSDVFEKSCSQLIKGLYTGQSGLVFVYGNTGTGKTYTMGLLHRLTAQSDGIIPEAFKQIFKTGQCSLSVSFCEIYMEEVYDLLAMEQKKLNIRETINKQPYIENLLKIRVHNFEQASKLINIGLERRVVAEQKLNRNSSRSHALITLYLKNSSSVGKLCFVDLAGSQRIKETQSKGVNLTEALHINSSLSALQTLLINLSTKSLPTYRGNKLTRLLQPYFETGKISLIVTHDSHNIQPIEFGKRCKGIKFIERQHEDQSSIMRTSFTGRRDSTPNKQENDRLLYYVNCLVGLLSKIHKYIEDLVKKEQPPKPFSVAELVGSRDGKASEFVQIQQALNSYLNELDERQKAIKTISIEVQEPENIMTKLDNNKEFIGQIQNIGKSILINTRFMHDLADVRKNLRQQVATSQFKCYLLEKKGRRGEEAIEYLVNKIDKGRISEVCDKMKSMGIQVDVRPSGTARDVPVKEIKDRSKQKGGGEFIYIDQQHSNL